MNSTLLDTAVVLVFVELVLIFTIFRIHHRTPVEYLRLRAFNLFTAGLAGGRGFRPLD